MRYYSKSSHSNFSTSLEPSTLGKRYSEILSTISNNFNLKQVKNSAIELHQLVLQLKNVVFYTYTNDIFEQLYHTRFVLSEEQFCQVQQFIHSYINSKGDSELIPYLDNYYHSIFQECPTKHITHEYKQIAEKYLFLAKSSENSDFSNYSSFVVAAIEPEYSIFSGYATGMKPFHDFVKFAKHIIAFNYFKGFLFNPEIIKGNISNLFSLAPLLNFEENKNPRLYELDLFVKFMEKEHWDMLLQFKNEPQFHSFFESMFFFKQPRQNSSSSILSCNAHHVHLVNYSNLENINAKKINLNLFVDSNNLYSDFNDFILKTIEKKMSNKNLTLDEEGHNHLLGLLKTQSYLHLLDKFPEKGLNIKSGKI